MRELLANMGFRKRFADIDRVALTLTNASNTDMQYEVEMKFPVAGLAKLETQLRAIGATISAPEREVDVYFAHPSRDFAQTDEALRLRRKGERFFITYKGPKIDLTTKTRQEIELPLATEEAGFPAWFQLLDAIGFRPVGEVRKSRRKATIVWQGRNVEGSLDQVEGLGPFMELELIADAEQVDAARENILSLAESLGLVGAEHRSYLELLMGAAGLSA